MAHRVNIGIAGFGNVGREFVRMLLERGEEHGLWGRARIVFIADSKGVLLDENGLDKNVLQEALSIPRSGLGKYHGLGHEGLRVEEVLDSIDILVDITPSVYIAEPPQLQWFRRVLASGGAVVTADKAPLAMRCSALLTPEWGSRVFYKATVMAGTPLIDLLRYGLRGRRVKRIRGALNGTSNYVLTLVENGLSLQEALRDAQAKGYAEPDARADLHGLDLAAKAAILSCTIGFPVSLREIHVEERIEPGIEERVKRLTGAGRRLRYIADICAGHRPVVRLAELDRDDPLWRSSGVLNAAEIVTEETEPLVLYGPGAGPRATAAALFSDLLLAIEVLRGG